MPNRLQQPDQEVISGQQATANHLKMRKILGKFFSHFPLPSALIARRSESTFSARLNAIRPLHMLSREQEGGIDAIATNPPECLQELLGLGISPNAVIRMVANYNRYVIFKVGKKEFAADKEIASRISVQLFG